MTREGMTRKDFLRTTAGAVAVSAFPGRVFAADEPSGAARRSQKPGPRRGVSLYSYSDDLFKSVTLEDCFAALGDLAADGEEIGLEILANSHVEGYPHPSEAWVEQWFALCERHHVRPVEYGHWVDSKLHGERAPWLSTEESYRMLVRDIELAHRLGFTCARTKLGVVDFELTPVPNWREFVKRALPVAQKLDVRMLPEIHLPTRLKSKMVDDYVDFIVKEKTTPWFGLNIDFGVFRRVEAGDTQGIPADVPHVVMEPSRVEDMIPLLPYVHCCHAKFVEMNDACEETTIPYPEIVSTLVAHDWSGYLLSEYEGADRSSGGAFTAVRKQHVMLRRLLGEA